MIDDKLDELLIDYCNNVDDTDYLSNVTDIIDDYLNNKEGE